MRKSGPSQKPPAEQAEVPEGSKTTLSQPSQSPPGAEAMAYGGSTVGETKPRELTAEEMATAASIAQAGAAPTLAPPQGMAGGGGVATWVQNQRVSALWGIHQNRNSWVSIAGVGWKKLANNSDSAVVALTILAAHAKQMQTDYAYREEADGMIHECYVW